MKKLACLFALCFLCIASNAQAVSVGSDEFNEHSWVSSFLTAYDLKLSYGYGWASVDGDRVLNISSVRQNSKTLDFTNISATGVELESFVFSGGAKGILQVSVYGQVDSIEFILGTFGAPKVDLVQELGIDYANGGILSITFLSMVPGNIWTGDLNIFSFGYEPHSPAVPAPAAALLLAPGLAGLFALRKKVF